MPIVLTKPKTADDQTIVKPWCTLHAGQKLVVASNARIRIVANPTSWGKDILLSYDWFKRNSKRFIKRLKNPDKYDNLNPMVHTWLVAPHIAELRQLWREVLKMIPRELGAHWKIEENKAERMIKISSGEFQWITNGKSADKPETLVAEGLDYLGGDELRAMKQDSWYNLQSRLSRPGRAGEVVLIGTPGLKRNPDNRDELHFYYELMLQGQSDAYPDIESWNIHSNVVTEDNPYGNPYFSPEEFEHAKQRLAHKPKIFERDYKAYFIDFDEGDPVYPEFNEALNIADIRRLYNPQVPVLVGWDWGYNFPAVVFSQYHRETDQLIILAEAMGSRTRLDPFATGIAIPLGEALFPKAVFRDFGDGTGVAKKDTGESSIDELNAIFKRRYENKQTDQKRNVSYVPNTEERQSKARDVVAKRLHPRSDGKPGLVSDKGNIVLNDGFTGGYQVSERLYTTGDMRGHPKPLKDGYFDHEHNCLEFIIMNNFDVMGDKHIDYETKKPDETAYRSREDFYAY